MAYIFNTNSNTLVSGTSGKDTIQNGGFDNKNNVYHSAGSYVTIQAGAGNDSIISYSGNVTISGGAGNDYIGDYGDHKENSAVIMGEAGNDLIYNEGRSAKISGGKGKDRITLESISDHNVIQYASGDGDDTIFGFNSDDTLHITKGTYNTIKSGNDLIVKVGKGKITLKDALTDSYNKVTIKNSKGKVSVYNNWKIRYGSVESNYASNVTLAGSKSADSILNDYGSNVVISGGAGSDSIINNWGNNVTISGGAGNDSIENWNGKNVTINGGKGNETISLDNSAENTVIQYASGDGNDTISGFNSDDILHITKGSYKAKVSGNDVIVTVGKGKITLKNAKDKQIAIKDSKGKVTTKTYSKNISELWFADENIVTTSDNLSNIIAEKSVAEFETTEDKKIIKENLITYSK